MNYLGDFKEDAIVYLMFNTFTSNDPSASCTITNFANTDVHIHKDDGLTQRNNAAGITVSVDFDGITGSHMIKIDTNDNTVAGFWVTGKDYFIRIEGTTIDGATINVVVGHFSIENRNNQVDITHLLGTAWLSPGVAGTPDVNAKLLGGTAQTGNDVGADVNAILVDTGDTLDTLIKDIPTTAEFNARSLVSADYVVVGDTIAAVTDVTNDVGITQAAADKAWGTAARTLTSFGTLIQDIWDKATGALTTVGSIGKLLVDNINATISSRNSTTPPTVGEIRTEMEGGGSKVSEILTDTGTTLDTLIKDIPTVTEFNARSIPSADYTVVGDLITAASIATAVWDKSSAITLDFGTLLERAYQMLSNKMVIVDATGAMTLRNIGDSGDIASGSITDAAGTTTRSETTWV